MIRREAEPLLVLLEHGQDLGLRGVSALKHLQAGDGGQAHRPLVPLCAINQ
jgi:hypothetical protein